MNDQQWRAKQMMPVLGMGTGLNNQQLYDQYGGLIDTLAAGRKNYTRFRDNAGEFFSHPGALAAFQQVMGMQGRQIPELYGADWQSNTRAQMMGGIQGQIGAAQRAIQQQQAQSGYRGAGGVAAQAQLGQGAAQAQAGALTQYQNMLQDKLMERWLQQYQVDQQGTNMLLSLLGKQPTSPIVQKQQGPSGAASALTGAASGMAAGSALGPWGAGIGGVLGGLGGLLR